MSSSWPKEDLYWFLCQYVKGQGLIWTWNFVLFLHNNPITFLHTIMLLHTWVHHDPRRTSFDFRVIWSKVKVKYGLWTFQIFRTITITFWHTMMTLEACVAFDTRSNPIDFGVKVKLRKVEFVVGVIILLGIIFVPLRTGFISFRSHTVYNFFWNLSFWHIFMQFSWILRAVVLKACWLSKSS